VGGWSLTGNALGVAPIAFLGTTDNNALVIQTGSPSKERLRVDPSGQVGIGTATPNAALHIASGKGLRIDGGTSATDANNYFSFGGNGTFGIDAPGLVNGRFVVQNSGNVGIGTNAPASTLHVNGAVMLSPQSSIVLGSGAFGSVVGCILREVQPTAAPKSVVGTLTSRGSELVFYTNPLVGPPIALKPNSPPPPPPPAPSERLRIDCYGNVGIGTSAPIRALTVQGEASIVPNAGNGTSGYLNVSDATGSNGHNYSLNIRGLDHNGTDQVNLASINLLADNVGIGASAPIRALTVQGEASIVPNAGNGFSGYLNVSDVAGSNGSKYSLNIRGLDQSGTVQVNLASINLIADNVVASGNVSVTGDVLLTGADCAEEFDALGTQPPDAGTVMVIDANGALRESVDAYDKRVAGVVSGGGDYKHALVLDKRSSHESRVPLALVGKVYCKVDADHSPIDVGDLLTTSATPGHAMKATDSQKAFGCVIGKALRAVKEGQSLVPILVALQ
jgi:hypothetical protein